MSDTAVEAAPSRVPAAPTRQQAGPEHPDFVYRRCCLALVTVVLRLPSFLSSRHLVFDDGNYGVSVIDMRHGLAPYTGVFSAQGPLHFPLLYAGDLLGLRTINGPRVTPLLAGIWPRSRAGRSRAASAVRRRG